MSIDKSDIEHLCNLSKLNLDEEEQSVFLSQMQSILKMIEELQEVDTGEIEPMAHPLQMTQRLRNDEVTEFNERDKFQKNTDFAEDGFYTGSQIRNQDKKTIFIWPEGTFGSEDFLYIKKLNVKEYTHDRRK